MYRSDHRPYPLIKAIFASICDFPLQVMKIVGGSLSLLLTMLNIAIAYSITGPNLQTGRSTYSL
jgi:hypothetical protein